MAVLAEHHIVAEIGLIVVRAADAGARKRNQLVNLLAGQMETISVLHCGPADVTRLWVTVRGLETPAVEARVAWIVAVGLPDASVALIETGLINV